MVECIFSLTGRKIKEGVSEITQVGCKERIFLLPVAQKEKLDLQMMKHVGEVNITKQWAFGSYCKLWQRQPSIITSR